MSSSIDITALVLVFKVLEEFVAVPYFWIPEDNMKERVERDRVPYDVWVREGLIETTPGNVIDERYIVQRIEQIVDEEEYLIREVAYDRFGASLIAKDIEALGIKVIPFGQGFVSMSPPTKELMNLTLMQRLRHGGNKVLRWMANNMVVREDAAGNIKPDKSKSREKIDGMVALIQGLDRATRDEYKPSIYERRGIRSYG
jgi:phage terminase large subunit-like protein